MAQRISEPSRLITVVDALNNKYSEENCLIDDFAHIQLTSKQQIKVQVEALHHEKRKIVALEGCGITSAGKPGEIAEVCPLISELDVTDNQIKDWNEVFKILSQLKKLRVLNLCGNRLDDSSYSSLVNDSNLQTSMFNSLAELVLNNTQVSLCTVQLLLKVLPSVEVLHLSLNRYSCVPESEEAFKSVKQLHFNDNCIKQWKEVEKLGKMFPNLQKLIIVDNPLEDVRKEPENPCFSHLKSLSLTRTMLHKWEDVDCLRSLAGLKEVKLIGIPLLAQLTEDEARKLLVARLPNIDLLNGSRVHTSERDTAERHFIRRHNAFETAPERYRELVAVHGELSKLAEVELGRPAFADVVIHITGKRPRLEKVSLKQTGAEFRKYIKDIVQVPNKKFLLYYHDAESGYAPERMICKNRTLGGFGVKDGDEFYVDIVDDN